MGSFVIAVFTTQELYDKCENDYGNGYEARDLGIEIIEGAFSRSSNHSVTTKAGSKIVQAPQETMSGPFDAPYPCTNYMGSWNDLRDWWEYWTESANCKDPHASAADCHVLLTAASGGGRGANQAACVGGAYQATQDLSGYEDYGYSSGHLKAKNILHELGHNLTHSMVNNDDGSLAHDSARLYSHSNGNTITAMGIVGDTTTNNCSDTSYWYTNKRDNWDGEGWELRFSPCTESNIEERPR